MEVRRAALALAREVERRAPTLATSAWWKEERHGVFVDFNQNAKDRTVASAYSVRATPDARVSTPLFWDEVAGTQWMKIDGKIGCAFSSAGGWGGGMELACQSILTVLINFGFLVFGVTDYSGNKMTLHYGAVAAKAPREPETMEACRILGRRLAEWTALYRHGKPEQDPLKKDIPRMPPTDSGQS